MLLFRRRMFLVSLLFLWGGLLAGRGAGLGRQSLPERVPHIVSRMTSLGRLPGTNRLHLTFSLPLRDEAGLDEFLRELYNPASPNFHHFISPQEFTARFGPSAADYAKLLGFARASGFKITGTQPNRMLVDVSCTAATAERVFGVTLRTYHHPGEKRDFYAPDSQPSVAAPVKLLEVCGLNNYSLPRPKSVLRSAAAMKAQAVPHNGSGSGGSYLGNDFRAAYVPGTALTGSGQSVALVQFDGYYASDIASYLSTAGYPLSLTNALINVPVNGGVSTPGSGNGEVCLDIEMVMAMAPGISKIYVYEGPNSGTSWPTMLSKIANDNLARQVSCSWGATSVGAPDLTSENIFKQMAAQGISFFNASGDSDAFVGGIPFPSESTNITQVGGTTLSTTGPGGAWSSESVWNWGGGTGSSGGVSDNYGIPPWQQGIDMTTNQGSRTMRNVPDVALTGDNVYVAYNNGSNGTFGGTSCAAPLWAGLMALANQQAAAAGKQPLGFINPAVYELAKESAYPTVFHDITAGDNTWSSSPDAFKAVPGYDLCTGLGTPLGTNLINALVSPDALAVVPSGGFHAFGSADGVFDVTAQTLYLTNLGAASLDWSLINTSSWLSASIAGGTLVAGASQPVAISLNSLASNLVAGTYSAYLGFSNGISGVTHYRLFSLTAADPLLILPTNRFGFYGASGTALAPAAQTLTLTNARSTALEWGINNTSSWFAVSPASGSLPAHAQATVTITPTTAASGLPDGTYSAVLQVTNLASQSVQIVTGTLLLGQSLVQNGGFETGDFTGWTLTGHGGNYNYVDNGSYIAPHTGTYAAALGEVGYQAYLSQTLPTVAGQKYLLSLWLMNPLAGSAQDPNAFSVSWNGTTLYNRSNLAAFAWTNFQFIVTATGTSTALKIGGREDNYYLGLDDVAVTPVYSPSISVQPTNQMIYAGANTAFTVAAGGSAPLTYQWRKNGNNLANGGNLSGATTNVLQFSSATANNAGDYSVVITNAYGVVTSAVATLTVNLRSPTLILASSKNPAGYHDSVNFTAVMNPVTAGGGVQFFANGTAFDSEPIVAGSAASVFFPGLPRGTNLILAIYSGDANDLPTTNSLWQVVTNHPPTVAAFYTNRYAGLPLNIPIATLAAHWNDVDGDAVSLAGVTASTNGIAVTNNGTALTYVNTDNVSDQFTCVVTDGWGGTNFQAVHISVLPLPTNAIPRIANLTQVGGDAVLNLSGAPGHTYILETTSNLFSAAGWQPVATNVLGTNGVWQFNSGALTSPRQFYRLKLEQ